jgi:hypothetical protein
MPADRSVAVGAEDDVLARVREFIEHGTRGGY